MLSDINHVDREGEEFKGIVVGNRVIRCENDPFYTGVERGEMRVVGY